MATKNDPDQLATKVRSSYTKLLTAASALNSASDRFTKLIAEIEAALKPLNVGITAWVRMGDGWHDDDSSGYREVGYCKYGGKWCIAISEVEEYRDGREDGVQLWTFGEAPRRLRLQAIDYIADLLDALANVAVAETGNIAKRTNDLELLVSALKDGSKQ
jgi:hypothetical protein